MAEIKKFYVQKKLRAEAKAIGLNYTTFFVFLVVAAIVLITGSTGGFIGVIIAIILVLATYATLFILQTKLGPKQISKLISNFYNSIPFIKVSTSYLREKKYLNESRKN